MLPLDRIDDTRAGSSDTARDGLRKRPMLLPLELMDDTRAGSSGAGGLLRLDATLSSSASGAVEEGGSGLTSEAERAYWIGQQLIWNPPTVSSLLNDGWGSIVLVFFVEGSMCV